MSDQAALIIFGVIIIAVTFIMIKTAKSVFIKTGVNTISGIHKVLWYVEMLPIFYAITLLLNYKTVAAVLIIIASVLVFSALHFLLSKKAGTTNAIIMGVFQGVAGGLAALLNIFVLVANIALKTNIKLFEMDMATVAQINQNQDQQNIEAQKAKEKADAEKDERAEAVAQRAGFRNADEAENAGFDTGKNYK